MMTSKAIDAARLLSEAEASGRKLTALPPEVRPGSIEEAYALVTKDVPLGRPADAEDVSNVVCFLASGEAAMVNGAVVTVDGGAGTVDLPTLAFVQ